MFTTEESASLSLIRILSVILIISCHLLQAANNILAWWLNVGVQIFFFLSGYLVGQREIFGYREWYKKRLRRILKPYYLYVLIILPILYFMLNEKIGIKQVMVQLLCLQGSVFGVIKGLEHLWFIPVIVVCYLIVPFIKSFNIGGMEFGEAKFISLVLLQCTILQILLIGMGRSFACGVAVFLIGFYFSSRYKTNFNRRIKLMVGGCTLVLLPINIFMQNYFGNEQTTLAKVFAYEFTWYHALMGIAIFMFLFDFFVKYKFTDKIKNKLKFIDDYSYEIYITHHVFILGSSPLLFATSYSILNLFIVLVAIGISAYLLKTLNGITLGRNSRKSIVG